MLSFSDRQVNSVDPDQTVPRGAVWSRSTQFAIFSAYFGHITLWLSPWFEFKGDCPNFVGHPHGHFFYLGSQTAIYVLNIVIIGILLKIWGHRAIGAPVKVHLWTVSDFFFFFLIFTVYVCPLVQFHQVWLKNKSWNFIYEPPCNKTNKMAFAPSEDSDQPEHPPSLIRVFAIHMKKAWVLSYPLSAQQRLWSDWTDAQADLSLRWAHSHFVGFVMRRLKCNNLIRFGDFFSATQIQWVAPS